MRLQTNLLLLGLTMFCLPLTTFAGGGDMSIYQAPSNFQADFNTKTIQVTGTAKVQAKADKATVTFSIQSYAKTYSEGSKNLNATLTKVTTDLTQFGVQPADIKTTWQSFYPEYDYSTEPAQISKYNMTRSISVDIYKNIDQIETVLDFILSKSTADTVISDINFNFGVVDSFLSTRQARIDAIQDAKLKATQLAEILGFTINSISKLEDTNYYQGFFTGQSQLIDTEYSLNVTYKFN
jgi:uncharacterized protein YggE